MVDIDRTPFPRVGLTRPIMSPPMPGAQPRCDDAGPVPHGTGPASSGGTGHGPTNTAFARQSTPSTAGPLRTVNDPVGTPPAQSVEESSPVLRLTL